MNSAMTVTEIPIVNTRQGQLTAQDQRGDNTKDTKVDGVEHTAGEVLVEQAHASHIQRHSSAICPKPHAEYKVVESPSMA